MNIKSLIKNYLSDAKLMQLATTINNQPWVCSVWFASDEDLNIYYFSSSTRRHSLELLKNPKVGAAIVLPQTPKDKPRGLQLQGTVQILTSKEDINKAISHYQDRIFPSETIKVLMESNEKPHKFYRITPSKYVLFDAVNFPNEARQEYDL